MPSSRSKSGFYLYKVSVCRNSETKKFVVVVVVVVCLDFLFCSAFAGELEARVSWISLICQDKDTLSSGDTTSGREGILQLHQS